MHKIRNSHTTLKPSKPNNAKYAAILIVVSTEENLVDIVAQLGMLFWLFRYSSDRMGFECILQRYLECCFLGTLMLERWTRPCLVVEYILNSFLDDSIFELNWKNFKYNLNYHKLHFIDIPCIHLLYRTHTFFEVIISGISSLMCSSYI